MPTTSTMIGDLGEGQTRSPNRTRRPTLAFRSTREDATELRCLVASQPPSCWTGSVVRAAIRIFFKPAVIVLIDLLILVPILLSIVSIVADLLGGKLDLPMDIQEEIGVVLIGWGVAMEERVSVRQIFRLIGGTDEPFQAGIDVLCHSSGVGLLIFGLFSEIAVAAIRLPSHIVPTGGIEAPVLLVGLAFIALSAYILGQHIIRLLIAVVWGRVPQPHEERVED